MMNVLLSIPDALSSSILTEWLTVKQIVRLDQAFLSHSARQQLLVLVRTPCSFDKIDLGLKSTTLISYCEWLARRSFSASTIVLPARTSHVLVAKLAQFAMTTCSTLTALQFHENPDQWESMRSVINAVIPHARNLMSLEIGKYNFSERFFWGLAQFCPHLHTLSMPDGGLMQNNMQVKPLHLPALRKLVLKNFNLRPEFFAVLAQATENLQELVISGSFFITELNSPFTHPWTHLVRLCVTDDMSEEVAVDILQTNHDLQFLIADSFERTLSDNILHCIAEHCRGLLEIDIQMSEASDAGMLDLMQNCQLLRFLSVTASETLGYDSSLAIATHGKNLVHINIEECFMENYELMDIVDGCPLLERFYFTAYEKLDDLYDPLFSLLRDRNIVVADEYTKEVAYRDDNCTNSDDTPEDDSIDSDDYRSENNYSPPDYDYYREQERDYDSDYYGPG